MWLYIYFSCFLEVFEIKENQDQHFQQVLEFHDNQQLQNLEHLSDIFLEIILTWDVSLIVVFKVSDKTVSITET